MISLVVAHDLGRVIGHRGVTPWHLPDDLARFRKLTAGGVVLVGRTTYEAIGRPLPGRTVAILTRDRDWRPGGSGDRPDLPTVNVLRGHLDMADILASLERCFAEVFVVGGEEVYRQALPLADCIYRTVVQARHDGDRHFPEFDEDDWLRFDQPPVPAAAGRPAHRFSVLERKATSCPS